MVTFNLFSKRQKKLRGEFTDVYSYDEISQKLKVQIVHIIRDTIGEDNYQENSARKIYEFIFRTLCKEYGVFKLSKGRDDDYQEQILNFILQSTQVEEILDVVELSFKCIEHIVGEDYYTYRMQTTSNLTPEGAISELNERFRENGIGYSFEGNEIIRVDSTYVHSEITKPTIALLWNEKFAGANEEYLKAHEHYRHGRNKECLTECLKAFESTMKIILTEKGWAFNQSDPAKKLIQVCFQNDLIPTFTQNQFTSLQNLLESGIPTIRNKLGGHGQGAVPQKVDDGMTRYGLNLTGTNIIFLIEQSGIV